MGATVQLHEITSTTTGVDKTSGTVRFKAADETTVDSSNRLVIPAADTDWSYTKQLRLYISAISDVEVSNPHAYTDGINTFATGITVKYDSHTAFQTQTNENMAGTDIITATVGASIDMDQYNDTTGKNSTGYYADVLRLQMSVASTANAGPSGNETLTFTYDEGGV